MVVTGTVITAKVGNHFLANEFSYLSRFSSSNSRLSSRLGFDSSMIDIWLRCIDSLFLADCRLFNKKYVDFLTDKLREAGYG